MAKAAEHLSEMREMARFHISHTKLSKKTTPGVNKAIESEVAAAVEGQQSPGDDVRLPLVPAPRLQSLDR